jgi:hypothetical protein
MIPPAPEPFAWSRRRWWLTTGAVFLAHVGAVLWLSDRSPRLPAHSGTHPALRILDREQTAALPETLLADDPTLLVLANHEGFSGAAWLAADYDYEPVHWSEPVRWLPLPLEQLGESFELFVRTNPPPAFQLTEKLPIRAGFRQLLPPAETIRTQSVLRVEGPIQLRSAAPNLPVWPHHDVLNPTIVEVAVDSSGQVQSARLAGWPDARSGLAEADGAALALARVLQFDPREGGGGAPEGRGVVWGKLTFHWHAQGRPRASGNPGNPPLPDA